MRKESIAIIGAACRLPGAPDLAQFWHLLHAGRDAVTEVPEGRWSKRYFYHPHAPTRGKSYSWAAGTVGDIEGFDADFFGISPREAEQIDPQQRLLLELAWEAIEDAGLTTARLAGADAGVYIGASSMDYAFGLTGDPAVGSAYFMTGTSLSIFANRISYVFNLRGPSLVVDTACSSSMVALDLACRAIDSGRVELAVVGGVNLLLSPYPFLGFSQAQMLSRRGHCFAFDERADGYVRAEGGGVVILKPLRAALADGDAVRAVILGTGVNQDGQTVGLSLPSGAAQASLLRSLYREQDIAPDALSFIEAHGTGTAAGDPIEAGALGEALGRRRAAPLPIGSVKSNLGHLEPASGMAGLLKSMLALEHRLLPASLHCATPNSRIPFEALNLEVATSARALAPSGPLVAGVNSFGFGGTNAHAILGTAPPLPARPAGESSRVPQPSVLPPLLLSARSEGALRELARTWSDRLADLPVAEAAPLVRGQAHRRDRHPYRLVAAAPTPALMAARLRAADGPADPAAMVQGKAVAAGGGKLAFVFSGNGAQWAGMARDALALSAIFRDAAAAVDGVLSPLLGWSPLAALGAEPPPSVERTDVAQPLLFLIQVAMVEALRAEGVVPDFCLGHSVGEIAAAWASGALSLADAAHIVVERSRQQERTRGTGRLAALGMAVADAEALIARVGGVEIAAINSATAITVAGPEAALRRLGTLAGGVYFQLLELDYPFHSAAMEPIRDDLIAALAGTVPRDCGERFASAVTGGACAGTMLDAAYWWRNIREPVRFSAAIDHLVAAGARIFVEIGPNPILLSYLRGQLRHRETEGRVLGTLGRQAAQQNPFPRIAAECFAAGHDISAAPAFDGPIAVRGLPLYPWQRSRHWFSGTSEGLLVTRPFADHPLLGFRRVPEEWRWINLLDTNVEPRLADHSVEGQPVLPAAGFVEIAAAAARARFGEAPTLEIANLEIVRALPLASDQARELTVELGVEGGLTVSSRARLSHESRLPHAFCRLAAPGPLPGVAWPDLAPGRIVPAASLYEAAARLGLDYGPAFRPVAAVEVAGRAARVIFDDREPPPAGYLVDPAQLDGALQGFLALLMTDDGDAAGLPGESFLPFRFGRVRYFAPYGRAAATARVRLDHRGQRSASGALALFDGSGAAIVEIEECWFRRVVLRRRIDPAEDAFRFVLAASPDPDYAVPKVAAGRAIAAAGRDAGGPGSEESALLLEAFLAASAHEALRGLASDGGDIGVAALRASGCLAEDSVPLLEQYGALLVRNGIAEATEAGWHLRDNHLPRAKDIWRTLLAERPEMAAELALAGAAAAGIVARLGGDGAVPPPSDLVEQMHYASPTGRRALAAVSDAVGSLVERWPEHRPLRVLEIGARTGGLTRRLLPLLSARIGTLSYIASDPDPDNRPRLEALVANRAGAAAVRWNPETDAAPPGGPDGFDVVVSLYGLTRIGGGEAALAAVARAAAGALLIAVEPLPHPIWDAVFGQIGDNSPANGEAWCRRLRRAGFAEPRPGAVETVSWPFQPIAAVGAARASSVVVVAATPSPAPRRAIVIAPASNQIAQRLTRHLEAAGMASTLIDPPAAADGARLLSALTAAGETVPDIIVLPPRHRAGAALAEGATERLANILTVIRLAAGTATDVRLHLVTRDAQQLAPAADGPAPIGAAAWAMGRVIANELPRIAVRLVDFPVAMGAEAVASRLAHEIVAPDAEQEIVWTATGRRVLRLRRGLPKGAPLAAERLGVARPGLLDSLEWRGASDPAPGAREVAIAVRAAGVNFRDVMWALDMLPEEALKDGFSGPGLGLECAGTVTAVGAEVTEFAVGDRVAGFAPAAMASRVVTAADAIVRLPEGMDFAAAAALPVAYLTAIYALGTRAQLAAGETVLIHGGAGGVGIAAIHYARHRGARIIATAGSETKRAFLRLLGVDEVFDSRSLAFADAVMAATGGEGVDVVLNSLGGEAMERSLGVLKPFGRFLELGKRDFYLDTRVGLRPLRRNISYFAIDADQLPLKRPDLAKSLLSEVLALTEAGALQPLPRRLFGFAEASDAFRLMQGSGHIGKIVLCPEAPATPARVAGREFLVRPEANYLIVGGLSGFGLATAHWLVSRGARHLALAGRRGIATPGAEEALAAFAAAGTEARAYSCDITDEQSASALLAEVRGGAAPLAGVIHAAMVLDDALLADLTAERIAAAMTPKLKGADILDRLTRADALDWLLFYSSATTIVGAPGQGNYVAANAALEGLARRRRAAGLPALAIAWGPIADAGFLAARQETREALARRLAAAPMMAADALDALPALWASGLDTVALASLNWSGAKMMMPLLSSPSFADFATAMTESGGGDLRERLDGLSPAEARETVASLLVEEIGRILLLAPEKIERGRPLATLGMDSLMAVELRLALETRLGISLPLLSLSEGTDIAALAALVVRTLGGERPAGDGAATVARHESDEDILLQAAARDADARLE